MKRTLALITTLTLLSAQALPVRAEPQTAKPAAAPFAEVPAGEASSPVELAGLCEAAVADSVPADEDPAADAGVAAEAGGDVPGRDAGGAVAAEPTAGGEGGSTPSGDGSPPAQAPPDQPAPQTSSGGEREPEGGDFFFKAYTGVGLTNNSDLTITQPAVGNNLTFSNVGWDHNSFDLAPYYGIRIGYWLEDVPWLGVMVDYNHYKILAQTGNIVNVNGTRFGAPISATVPMSSIVQQYENTNGVSLFGFSALGRLQLEVDDEFPTGRWQPYVGLGLGPTMIWSRTTVDGVKKDGPYEFSNVNVQAMTGIQFLIIPEVDIFLEYKFTHTLAEASASSGGTGSTVSNTNHIIFGTGYHW